MDIQIDGLTYVGFTSKSVTTALDQLAGTFVLSANSEELANYPIKQFSFCKILIGANPILTGDVEIIKTIFSSSTHGIEIQGRSKTSVVVDSSVWDKKTFKQPVGLATIAEKVIRDLDSDIQVLNFAGVIPTFKKDINAEVGETAFDFLERLARQRQVLLTTNGFGDLVFTKGNPIKILTLLLHQKSNEKNNVLSAIMTYDTSLRFSEYKVLGQAPSDDTGFDSPVNQTVIKGESTDVDALSDKKLIIVAEEGIDIDTAQKRADWESNIRRARSAVYRCQVQGHKHLQGIWDINQLVRVVDDYSDIDSDMLIKRVEFIESNEGTFTNLELVAKDAYTLETSIPTFERKLDNLFND